MFSKKVRRALAARLAQRAMPVQSPTVTKVNLIKGGK